MKIVFLGTSSGVPTKSRNVSSVALRLPQRAEVWLFDCGEGTQHQLLRSEIKSSQIRRIFITHMHGDHIFGLMGLLASIGLAGPSQTVDIYGPEGLENYLRACTKYSCTHLGIGTRVYIHTVPPLGGLIYEDAEFTVSCLPLKHRIPAYGYRVSEKDRPGTFNLAKAKQLNIPPGPVYGQLKQGKTVKLKDGRILHGKDFCGEPEIGRKFVYCTDTVFCDAAVDLAQDADVLIHEATFAHQDAKLAFERLHSTSTMAAQVALLAQVKRLIITHFSPRYAPGNVLQIHNLLAEAQAIFPNTFLAHDFLTYEIPRRKANSKLIGAKN